MAIELHVTPQTAQERNSARIGNSESRRNDHSRVRRTGGFMRLIALSSVMLLASLQIGAQEAQTTDDKSHEVINLENAWNHPR
jgi:hypothetical protein